MMALELTVEALPLPINVSFSFRQVPAKLANRSKQKVSGGKNHCIFKKGHEKQRKTLAKNPQFFSFHMGLGSSSGGGQR